MKLILCNNEELLQDQINNKDMKIDPFQIDAEISFFK